jgi:hypothetical protein
MGKAAHEDAHSFVSIASAPAEVLLASMQAHAGSLLFDLANAFWRRLVCSCRRILKATLTLRVETPEGL